MQVTVHATGLEMTQAIKEYCEDKVDSLDKFHDEIMSADVTVGLHSQHQQKGKIYFAKYHLQLPGKDVHVEKTAEDLYKAIDKVRDHLKVELDKIKGKGERIDREVIREQKAYHDDL